jgi:hypothetical protein
MKFVRTVLFGLLPILSFGQSCEIFDGAEINYTDRDFTYYFDRLKKGIYNGRIIEIGTNR